MSITFCLNSVIIPQKKDIFENYQLDTSNHSVQNIPSILYFLYYFSGKKMILFQFLSEIEDYRRKEGRRYQLPEILEFSILAILSGAKSYRNIEQFIRKRYPLLNDIYSLNWKRLPSYTTIRNIICNTPQSHLENAFREFSKTLEESTSPEKDATTVSIDGKVIRGSFDNFTDQKAVQILGAFLQESNIILGHIEISTKKNEIPMAQVLIDGLELTNTIFTFDALHCQKKR